MVGAQKTLIVIATYNEIENLPGLVAEIHEHADSADVLVIDDHSPDGTGEWVQDHSASDPKLRLIARAGKLGLGSAQVLGMRAAIEGSYAFVITMDADFSHHPKYLPDLLRGMTPAQGEPLDVMIGSRYIPGGGIEGWPWRRHFMSRAVNLYTRGLLRMAPKDCSGGYRCYRVSRLKELDFGSLLSRGYSFQEEILWRLKLLGARIGETPIVFADRVKGSSKINLGEAAVALKVILRLALSRRSASPSTTPPGGQHRDGIAT